LDIIIDRVRIMPWSVSQGRVLSLSCSLCQSGDNMAAISLAIDYMR